MRLLLDENVGVKRWAELLISAGHDVERVVDVGLQGSSDAEVISYACEQDRAIISRDKAAQSDDDLRTVWSAQPEPKPLLLLIFPGEVMTPADIVRAVGNLEAQNISSNLVCALNAWRY